MIHAPLPHHSIDFADDIPFYLYDPTKGLNSQEYSSSMVFWASHPLQFFYPKGRFDPRLVEKDPLPSPTNYPSEFIIQHDISQVRAVRIFLRTHFGTPPDKPTFDIPESDLLGPQDHVMIVRDKSGEIAGCIRYHYLGKFVTQDLIYCVDCFCIHPRWRKKGVGDYLLTQLHIFVNQNNIPYSIFLKEGPSLSILSSPHGSGVYVYRALTRVKPSSQIQYLSMEQAHRLLEIHRQFRPDTFMILHTDRIRQHWILWRHNTEHVLACVQDTYQRKGSRKMGWITAWMESPSLALREEASKEIADACYPMFDDLWMNRLWVGDSKEWTMDGGFHWYLYQWETYIPMGRSYAILT